MSWEEDDYVLNVPNRGVAGPAPNAPARNVNKNRLRAEETKAQMQKELNAYEQEKVEQRRLHEKVRENAKMNLIRHFSGRPNENYQLENWAKARGFKNNNIEGMREQIRITREARPGLVAATKEMNEENAALMRELNNNNNSNIDPNQVGGKRRRKSHRSTRKSRKAARKSRKAARKSHKRRVARKNRRTNRR